MRLINEKIVFSPSDLVTFFKSPFASWMDRAAFHDRAWLSRMDPEDPLMTSLSKRGSDHETAYNLKLAEQGRQLVDIASGDPSAMFFATASAMRNGADVITQGYLQRGRLAGIADLLIRVPLPSKLGSWHYEIWDTKLSRSMKPQYAVQLCAYADMLEGLQGVRPESISIVLGNSERVELKTRSYMAFYRGLLKRFLEMQDAFDPTAMPDPGASSEHGRWSELATSLLEERDHLSQVATITSGQIKALSKAGIMTRAELAKSEMASVPKIGDAVFSRLRRQAALQISSTGKEKPDWELAAHDNVTPTGLKLLPPASPNDIFFDLEGFPLVEGGLEYLWGATYFDQFSNRAFLDFWAHDRDEEKSAFVSFVRWAYARWLSDTSMHIYHYAAYEVSALRRLMGRYGVMEYEVDQLLRNNVFVDLFQIVRQALVVGEPRYSIKNIEHLYREKRQTEVASGGASVVVYEQWRENRDGDDWSTSKVLRDIRDYNRDDCDSTEELTRWLRAEQLRASLSYAGTAEVKEPPHKEERDETAEFREVLLKEAALHGTGHPPSALPIELLAHSLDFHERENKPVWWRYFDRQGMSEAELFDDPDCLSGLQRTASALIEQGGRSNKASYEYFFNPDQDFKNGTSGYRIIGVDAPEVSIDRLDEDKGRVWLKAGFVPPDRLSLVPLDFVNPKPIPAAIARAAQRAKATAFAPSALIDFLGRSRPRIVGNQDGPIIRNPEALQAEIDDAIRNLNESCLCIQGPPGAGKTHAASRAIHALLMAGRSVGVTSNSHKAINLLISGVLDYADEERAPVSVIRIDSISDRELTVYGRRGVSVVKNATEASSRLRSGAVVVGGTAWAYSHADMEGKLDYLFVDEAGQVSIANLIGMSTATRNIVLMGDQMQLGQPIQGSHPGSSGMSLLEFYMEGQATIPVDQGVFLPTTHRMHSHLCGFISKAIYEGRLTSEPKTDLRFVEPAGPLITKGTGIVFHPVPHVGNTQASDEEVEAIVALTKELLCSSYMPGGSHKPRLLSLDDILFITPYNQQRRKLQTALGAGAKVGTVDKFQGQGAPVVILSMCTSDVNESPRGMEFLFSKNRLNVAISRAECLAIVVASPGLEASSVSTLMQMELVNLFQELMEAAVDR
ncbi:TM0106 family RecB-like putative nuclease [Rhizobium sp. NZLR11]|uniref:TM0106 family RecB-like putative nuclease n=1 Tax=Rhizobium sp. NZLR11 TaxID=2731098 RepID=UPI001C83FC7C|nr:TM0106 family RecB-like putative nuclease [Rhizobium sp. NZLR11]MBX5167032.1 TM0106 family RecB-like putative nuclease [Rhizobium sp. NZLR4b]MBX5211179.1 TM0106 family RecB-like putative nuclease [Rhizobium sp. NZLR11]